MAAGARPMAAMVGSPAMRSQRIDRLSSRCPSSWAMTLCDLITVQRAERDGGEGDVTGPGKREGIGHRQLHLQDVAQLDSLALRLFTGEPLDFMIRNRLQELERPQKGDRSAHDQHDVDQEHDCGDDIRFHSQAPRPGENHDCQCGNSPGEEQHKRHLRTEPAAFPQVFRQAQPVFRLPDACRTT